MKLNNYYSSPIGLLKITFNEEKLIGVAFAEEKEKINLSVNALYQETCQQLEAYFTGKLQVFTLPLLWQGTAFQKHVWQALLTIPYGQTYSYQTLAEKIGHPRAYRAVGNANHANPWVIMVPCHRVIKADGSLGGYGGGLAIKKYLLTLEQKNSKSVKTML